MRKKSVSACELSQAAWETNESTIGADDSFVRDSRFNPFVPQTPLETIVVKNEPFNLTGADQAERLAASKTEQAPNKWGEKILFIALKRITRSSTPVQVAHVTWRVATNNDIFRTAARLAKHRHYRRK